MHAANFPYPVGDATFAGYLADGSDGAPAPGVLVAHEGPGLDEHTRARARDLADLGYVALALDLYGQQGLPVDQAKEWVQRLRADRRLLRDRGSAALDALRAHPSVDPERVAAVGFCFGGAAMLELARERHELGGVVGFHSGLDLAVEGFAEPIACPVLLCHGDEDPVVPAELRAAFLDELRANGTPWQAHVYGGVGHSFTNPDIDAHGFPGFAYDPTAHARSWGAMAAFLGEVCY